MLFHFLSHAMRQQQPRWISCMHALLQLQPDETSELSLLCYPPGSSRINSLMNAPSEHSACFLQPQLDRTSELSSQINLEAPVERNEALTECSACSSSLK